MGVDSKYVLEAGEFYVGEGADKDCRFSDQTNWQSDYGGAVMCSPFNLTLSAAYDPLCEYGCNLWGTNSVDRKTVSTKPRE